MFIQTHRINVKQIYQLNDRVSSLFQPELALGNSEVFIFIKVPLIHTSNENASF